MNCGFIGVGNLAGSVIKGMLGKRLVSPGQVLIYEIDPKKRLELESGLGVKACESYSEVIDGSDICILAVKPHILQTVLPQIRICLEKKSVPLVSVAAGKSIAEIETMLGIKTPVIRVMPNVNAAVGESMSAYCANAAATQRQIDFAVEIFSAVGKVVSLDESMFGVFSAIAGASPAFAFLFIDSIARAAHKAGMNRGQAVMIAAQAVLGSAKNILESGEHPWELIDKVTSPGGTTVEGVYALQQKCFEASVISAVDAVIEKDKKL